ncbi:ATP-binding cassette domain-containing protein [Heyndrickxia sporothermodurans]
MKIKIEGLQKSYRVIHALKKINLQIGTGLFGLLGPNGAGKSTLMKILSKILPFDDGKVTIYDYDLVNASFFGHFCCCGIEYSRIVFCRYKSLI